MGQFLGKQNPAEEPGCGRAALPQPQLPSAGPGESQLCHCLKRNFLRAKLQLFLFISQFYFVMVVYPVNISSEQNALIQVFFLAFSFPFTRIKVSRREKSTMAPFILIFPPGTDGRILPAP